MALHPLRGGEPHFSELLDQNLIILGAMSLSSGVPVTWHWEVGQQPGQNVPPRHVGSPSKHAPQGHRFGTQTLSQLDTPY